jgi:glycosyltransferase involved in cell wall biosynthesis
MEEKFCEYTVLRVRNGGAACAVNHALKIVKGEYLTWADCDDELLPRNIELKVKFLDENPGYGMVNCEAQSIDYESGQMLNRLAIPRKKQKEDMFYQILDGVPCYPGVFMIRSQLLFCRLVDREIHYNPEAGQNYQLLLPVAYFEKCGFIHEVLYNYYVRKDSHSHDVDYERSFYRTYVREEFCNKILTFMPEKEKKQLMNDIHAKCENRRFCYSYSNNDIMRNNASYQELKRIGKLNIKIKLKHFLIAHQNILKKLRAIRVYVNKIRMRKIYYERIGH